MRPANQFVAGVLGARQMNFLNGGVGGPGMVLTAGTEIALPGLALPADTPLVLGLRPEPLMLQDGDLLATTVRQVEVLGAQTVVHAVTPDDTPPTIFLRGIVQLVPGQGITLGFDPAAVQLFGVAGMAVAR